LVIEPYLATVVLGGGLVAALGSAAERRAILPGVMEGRCFLAFAHDDQEAPTRAQRASGGYVLQGRKKVVLGCSIGDMMLLSPRLDGDGIGVFVLPRETRGLTLRPYRMVDGGRAADVALTDVA